MCNGLADGLVFDAVRVRLIEIGEAVRAIDPAVLSVRRRHLRSPNLRPPGGSSPLGGGQRAEHSACSDVVRAAIGVGGAHFRDKTNPTTPHTSTHHDCHCSSRSRKRQSSSPSGTVYELIWDDELAPIRIGRSVRLTIDDLQDYVQRERAA